LLKLSLNKIATRSRAAVVLVAFLQSQLGLAQLPGPQPLPADQRPALVGPNPLPDVVVSSPGELATALAKSLLNIDSRSVDSLGNHKPAALAGLVTLRQLYQEDPNLNPQDAEKVSGLVYKAIDIHLNDPQRKGNELWEGLDKTLDAQFTTLEIAYTRKTSPSQLYGLVKNAVIMPLKMIDQQQRDELRAYGEKAIGGDYDRLDYNWLTKDSFSQMLSNPRYLSAVSKYLERWNRVPLTDPAFDFRNPSTVRQFDSEAVRWVTKLGNELGGTPSGTRPNAARREPAGGSESMRERPVSEQFAQEVHKRLDKLQRELIAKGVYDPKAPAKDTLPPEEAKRKLDEIHTAMAPARTMVTLFKSLAGNDREAQAAAAILDATVQIATTRAAAFAGAIGTGTAGGGYVGAIVGLFVALVQILGSGPSLNEILLKEVRELRQAVAQVLSDLGDQSTLLHHQFADTRDLINRRFDAIESLFGVGLEKIEKLQRQTHETLRGLEFQLAEQQQGQRHGVRQKELTELSKLYVQRPEAAQGASVYAEAMTHLLLCATQTSRGTDWTGTALAFRTIPGEPLNLNPRLARELAGDDPRNQMSVIYEAQNRLIGDVPDRPEVLQGVTPATDDLSPVANPRLWTLCAAEYLERAKTQADLYETFDPDLRNLRAIIDTGHRFQLAGARLAPAFAGGGRDLAPLIKIIENYETQIAGVEAALEKQRSEGHAQLRGIDPMKSIEQIDVPVSAENAIVDGKLRPCPDLEWPKTQHKIYSIDPKKMNKYTRLIPKEAALAAYLGKGNLRFCFDDIGYEDQNTVYDYHAYDTRDRIRMGTAMMVLRLEFVPNQGRARIVGRWKAAATIQVEISREEQRVFIPTRMAQGDTFAEAAISMRTLDEGKFRKSHPKDNDLTRSVRMWRQGRWDEGKFKSTEVRRDTLISWEKDLESQLDHLETIDLRPKPKSNLPIPFAAEEAARLNVLKQEEQEDRDQKLAHQMYGPSEEEVRGERLFLVRSIIHPAFAEARAGRARELAQAAQNREGLVKAPAQGLDGARQLLFASLWLAMGSALEKDPELLRLLGELPNSEALGAQLAKNPSFLVDQAALKTTFDLSTKQKLKELRTKLEDSAKQKEASWRHDSVSDLMQRLETQFVVKGFKQQPEKLPESLRSAQLLLR
jgi:hypothetical protein